jgi:hypothetical protein
MSALEQAQTPVSQVPEAGLNDGQGIFSEADSSSSIMESMRAELTSLSLRQAQVQERIQHIRHALAELVQLFGPEVLATSARPFEVASPPLSRKRVKIVDLARDVFAQSREWLTLNQVVELIRKKSDTALARFINPGVAVSNAIRALERHGEVEVSHDRQLPKWRFVERVQSCANRITAEEKNY